MVKLKISYSIEQEISRIVGTLSKISWYRDNGYKVVLPKLLSEKSSLEEIREKVLIEYKNDEYLKIASEIGNMWNVFLPEFEKVKDVLLLQEEYELVLTKYGTGGSYDSKSNKIISRIVDRDTSSIFGTLLHEITHIAFEPLIKKYNISHWKKERLVDLIGQRYFSNKRKLQVIKEDVSMVDNAFNQFFPDIEEVVRRIS